MDLVIFTMRREGAGKGNGVRGHPQVRVKSGQICTHIRAKIHTQKSKPKTSRELEKRVWAGKKTLKGKEKKKGQRKKKEGFMGR